MTRSRSARTLLQPGPANLPAASVLGVGLLLAAPLAHAGFTLPDGFADEPIVGGLAQPVNLALVPDGRALIVERYTGRVRLIVAGALAAIDPVLTVDSVQTNNSERGLLGVAVDPAWPERPYVYVYYSYAGGPYGRLSRYRAAGDLEYTGDGTFTLDPASRFDLLSNVPDVNPVHSGGTLRFGPDSTLYVALGDDNFPCDAQKLGVLRGKILRLRVSELPDGPGANPDPLLLTPPDNPFVPDANPNARLVAAWGLRNPFSFAVDRETGGLMIADVGADSWEEIDEAASLGLNFEWPFYEGPRPATTCANADTSRITDPVFAYDHDVGVTVISGVLYRRPPGAARGFPSEYEGSYFFHDFYRGWIRKLARNGNTWVIAPPVPGQPSDSNWASGRPWVSSFEIAPDGSIWYVQNWTAYPQPDGQVRRIARAVVADSPSRSSGLEGVVLAAPRPNPATEAVALEFSLPSTMEVELTIHDATGRRVRSLIPGDRLAAGVHRVTWDGRVRLGNPAPPGLYLIRLRAGAELRLARVIRTGRSQ